MTKLVNKKRKWVCECGTTLTSPKLDADTFERIPDFKPCPICGKGALIKRE